MADPIRIAKDKRERTVLKNWAKEHTESRKELPTSSRISVERVYASSVPSRSYLDLPMYGLLRATARF